MGLVESADESHPITQEAITKRVAIRGEKVRAAVHRARIARRPICSSDEGYWTARTPQELTGTIGHLTERINSLAEVLRAVRQAQELLGDRV